MVRMTVDKFLKNPEGLRERTFRYDRNNVDDMEIINEIMKLLDTQKLCTNCVNLKDEGYFCGYRSHSCKIHGNIEAFTHPHHDCDGSKCDDYERII